LPVVAEEQVEACEEKLPPPAKDPRPTELTMRPGPSVAIAKLPAIGAVKAEGFAVSRGTFAGSVFDRGNVSLKASIKRIILPSNAAVAVGAPASTIEVFTEKNLGFMGHPPTPITAESVRHNMAIATREDGSDLLLGTFGEFDTHIEGGAGLLLFVRVPSDGVTVLGRRELSGEDSIVMKFPESIPYAKQEAGKIGYWYAPTNPAPGWTRLLTRPDPQQVVRSASPAPSASERAFHDPGPTEIEKKAAVACTFVHRQKAATTKCLATAGDPKLYGWLEVTVQLRDDGSIQRTDVFVGSLKNTPFQTCLVNEIAGFKFTARAAGPYVHRFDVGFPPPASAAN
jgi:hypothetical protein